MTRLQRRTAELVADVLDDFDTMLPQGDHALDDAVDAVAEVEGRVLEALATLRHSLVTSHGAQHEADAASSAGVSAADEEHGALHVPAAWVAARRRGLTLLTAVPSTLEAPPVADGEGPDDAPDAASGALPPAPAHWRRGELLDSLLELCDRMDDRRGDADASAHQPVAADVSRSLVATGATVPVEPADATRHGARPTSSWEERPMVVDGHDEEASGEDLASIGTGATPEPAESEREGVEVEGVPEEAGAAPPAAPSEAPPQVAGPPHQVMVALATALGDDDGAVRAEARAALAAMDRAACSRWATDALRSRSDREASVAAGVIASLGLEELAPGLLVRTVQAGTRSRSRFVRALSSLPVAPRAAEMVAAVPPERRAEAVRILSDAAGPGFGAHARALLVDSDPDVRSAVLEVLVGDDPEAATAELCERMTGDPDRRVRLAAFRLLADGPARARSELLAPALADPDDEVRAAAGEALATETQPATEERGVLVEMPSQAAPSEAAAPFRADDGAVESLVGSALRVAGAFWAHLVQQAPLADESLRSLVGAAGPRLLYSLACAEAASPDPGRRAFAILLGEQAGEPHAADIAARALHDLDPEVRRAAAGALGRLAVPDVATTLVTALADPDPSVRVEAVHALAGMDDPAAVSGLLRAVRDPVDAVRDAATSALGERSSAALIGAIAATSELRAATERLVGPQPDQAALSTTGQHLDRRIGVAPYIRLLGSPDTEARAAAVEVLGVIGGRRAMEALVTCLGDPDETVRGRVLIALEHIGDADATAAIRSMAGTEPVADVAALAERVAGALGEPPRRPRAGEPQGGGAGRPAPSSGRRRNANRTTGDPPSATQRSTSPRGRRPGGTGQVRAT